MQSKVKKKGSLLRRKSNNSVKALIIDNEAVTDDHVISNAMNQQFIEGVNNLRKELNESTTPIKMDTVLPSIILDDVTEDEVINAIRSLKNSTSPGIDQIRTKSIKEISELISPIMTHLINRIIATGHFPTIFKTAIVTPLNKSGEFTNVTDYRPISLLTTFSKIIEKIIYSKLHGFTNDYLKLIYNRQYGFRKKCGTEIAALELVEHISNRIDNKKKISMVLMDIKKAFDMVDVKKLLEVLESYGIRGNAIKLVESYLTDRAQIVKINSAYSKSVQFTRGVVQGSILGPYLFSLYINYIYKLSINGILFLFADDCVLINEYDIDEPVDVKIISDMNIIINFFNYRGLILNAQKTKFMIFHSNYYNIDTLQEIKINDKENIQRVYEARYLGLLLDPCLKFEQHIQHISKKLASISGILWKLKNCLSIPVKKMIYHALFETHIAYLIPIWGRAYDQSIKNLQVIQNRALRNVFQLERLTNRVQMYTHEVENCLSIRALLYLNTATIVYNIIHKNIHSNITFTRIVTRNTRRKNQLHPQKARTSYGSRCLLTFGPKMFNDVPDDIKKLPHSNAFKWALRCQIRNETFSKMCLSSEFTSKYL